MCLAGAGTAREQTLYAARPLLVAPQPFDYQGLRAICYPGDQLHRVRERALPGPTRLVYRNRRFEPVEGFDALFADAAPPRAEP